MLQVRPAFLLPASLAAICAFAALVSPSATAVPPFPAIPTRATPAVILVPATIAPPNVATISGMCSTYNADVLNTGAISPNGAHHPGDCRFTDYDALFEGLPLAQYWAGVTSGATRPPYQVTLTNSGLGVCATATNFSIHLSGRALTSALSWPPNRPAGSACATEWAQHDPFQLVSPATEQSQVNSYLTQYAAELNRALLGAAPIQVCAARPLTTPAAAQRELTAKVGQLLTSVANQQQARWLSVRAQWEAPATGSQCTLHCNVCDAPGWTGTIVMTETITANPANITYRHTETDTFYIGGAALVSAGQTKIPFDWTAVGSGTETDPNGGKVWTVSAGQSGNCAPTPQNPQGGCVLVLAQGGMITFSPENQPFTVHNGIQLSQNGGAPAGYGASETQFPAFSAVAGATSVTGQLTQQPSICYAPMTPSPYTCTLHWSWNLSYH